MSTILNEGCLDPQTITISTHAMLRYCQRRGWKMNEASARRSSAAAEATIRRLLVDVATQRPPISVLNGHSPARRFVGGGMVWIVSADFSTLVTFYAAGQQKRPPRRRGPHKWRGASEG